MTFESVFGATKSRLGSIIEEGAALQSSWMRSVHANDLTGIAKPLFIAYSHLLAMSWSGQVDKIIMTPCGSVGVSLCVAWLVGR